MTTTEDGHLDLTHALEEMREAAYDFNISGLVLAASKLQHKALAMDYFRAHLRHLLDVCVGEQASLTNPTVQSALYGALCAHRFQMLDEAREIRQWLVHQNLRGYPYTATPVPTPREILEWVVAVQVSYDDTCTRVPHLAYLLGVAFAGTEVVNGDLVGSEHHKFLVPIGKRSKLLVLAWETSARCGGAPRIFHPVQARLGNLSHPHYSRDKPPHAQPSSSTAHYVAKSIVDAACGAKARRKVVNDRWSLSIQPRPKPDPDDTPF